MSIHCSWSPFQSYHDISLRNTNALSFCQFLWTRLFHMLLSLLHYSLRHSNILCEVRGFQKHTWRGVEYFLFHSLETNSFCRKLRFQVRHSCFFGWFQKKCFRYSFRPQRRSRRLSYSDFWLCGRNNLVQLLCKAGIRRRLKTAAPLGHSYGDTEVDYLLSRWEQVQPFPLPKFLLFLSLFVDSRSKSLISPLWSDSLHISWEEFCFLDIFEPNKFLDKPRNSESKSSFIRHSVFKGV